MSNDKTQQKPKQAQAKEEGFRPFLYDLLRETPPQKGESSSQKEKVQTQQGTETQEGSDKERQGSQRLAILRRLLEEGGTEQADLPVTQDPIYLKCLQDVIEGKATPNELVKKYNSLKFVKRSSKSKETEITKATAAYIQKGGKGLRLDSRLYKDSNQRSGQISSNSNADSSNAMKNFALPVTKGSKVFDLTSSNGDTIGIAHSMSGDLSKMSALTPEAYVATADSERFCGHHILSTIGTGTPAPLRGNVLFTVPINPRVWLDTRLGQTSLNYEMFVFNHIKFRYVSACPTTTAGALTLLFNPDIDQNGTLGGGIQNLNNAEEFKGTVTDNVWKSIEIGVANFQSTLMYTELNGENRFIFPGKFQVMCSTAPPANTDLGLLYMEYDVTFHKRVLNPIKIISPKSGSVTYQKLLNTGETALTFLTGDVIGGTVPPMNSRCSIAVYSATNMNNLNCYDYDSGTSTFTFAEGAEGYVFCTSTSQAIYLFRKLPDDSFIDNRVNVRSINGGATTVTFAFTWWVVEDLN